MSPFSAAVVAEILAVVPEWRDFVREELGADGRGFFVVELPAPEGSRAIGGLRIATADDEVTVSFDHYHAHFERWGVRERGMEHEAASTLVYALLGDELVVASGWDGERWCGSCELAAHEELDPSFLNGATRLRIRSWSGKLDADRDLGSAG